MLPASATSAYRAPQLLHDVDLLDLLEFTGRAVSTARLLRISQPTVSRRSRQLAGELNLQLHPEASPGALRYGDDGCLRLLRRAAKRHRLEAGVARIAADGWLAGLLQGLESVLPLPTGFRPALRWHQLVRAHVLDGALVCGEELRLDAPDLPPAAGGSAEPQLWQGCQLVPLGQLTLQLVRARHRAMGAIAAPCWTGVLLPPQPCCRTWAAWVSQQGKRALHLLSGHDDPAVWADSLAGNPVEALVTPGWRRQLAATGLELEPLPAAEPVSTEVWLLVHPRDWSRQPTLSALAAQMRGRLTAA